jgi:signal transduction histidine kinase
MKSFGWEQFKKLRWLLATDSPEPARLAERIVTMERDIVLPSKAGVLLVIYYFLFYSGWFYDPANEPATTQALVQEKLQHYFLIYLLCNVVGAVLFFCWRHIPPGFFQWLAFTIGLLDGLFIAAMTIVTGGYDSILFWVFPGLIVLNAFCIPLAVPQIVLNVILSLFYMGAVLATPYVWPEEMAILAVPGRSAPGSHGTNQVVRTPTGISARPSKAVWTDYAGEDNPALEITSEQLALRLSLLWLLTVCCYGGQVLLERQRVAAFEAGEFAAREGQLHSAGRLAAEFAHQIKNPLSVINNATYSLKRSLQENRKPALDQIEIIQEEVARADRVITQIMGYAQLSEGRVEKLDLMRELEQAIEQVFPAAVPTKIQLKKTYADHFPPLLMQRGHLRETFVNLLQNAREALNGVGTVQVTAKSHRDHAVEVSVADDGPGIPPEKLERIFEAYFTTKEKGTGLGLAIVKHNVELYGGSIRAESELGKGAKFTVVFPAKSLPKPFAK